MIIVRLNGKRIRKFDNYYITNINHCEGILKSVALTYKIHLSSRPLYSDGIVASYVMKEAREYGFTLSSY